MGFEMECGTLVDSARQAAAGDGLRIVVLVPSYRRPHDLARCLTALARQARRPDRVVVIARADDRKTRAVSSGRYEPDLSLTVVTVHVGGVVAALNAGLAAIEATGTDIVVFTDDDAAPRPDWLRKIALHFAADPRLGGLGGRDWIHQHGRLEDGAHRRVGKLRWFGGYVGNHHLGVGPPREVDLLKGVNMSFRGPALAGLRFDARLRGTGAQVGNEMGVSLAVKKRGWKLVYDPEVAVDHYPSIRHDEDQRDTFAAEAVRNAVFNETLLLCEQFRWPRKGIFFAWALLIGNRAAPGVLQWIRLMIGGSPVATLRFTASLAGRFSGWRAAS